MTMTHIDQAVWTGAIVFTLCAAGLLATGEWFRRIGRGRHGLPVLGRGAGA